VGGPPQPADKELLGRAPSLEEFWDDAHGQRASWWTSGTEFAHVAKVFELPADLRGLRALVIGVGQGQELHGFRDRGALPAGLDVSTTAIQRFGTEFPMFSKDTLRGAFDIMTMHLVTQHMSDVQVDDLFAVLADHLAPDGILHVQFAGRVADGSGPQGHEESLAALKEGARTRKILEVLRLCEGHFTVTDLRVSGMYPAYASYHLVASLRPKPGGGSTPEPSSDSG
jgi:hypothetical protein